MLEKDCDVGYVILISMYIFSKPSKTPNQKYPALHCWCRLLTYSSSLWP